MAIQTPHKSDIHPRNKDGFQVIGDAVMNHVDSVLTVRGVYQSSGYAVETYRRFAVFAQENDIKLFGDMRTSQGFHDFIMAMGYDHRLHSLRWLGRHCGDNICHITDWALIPKKYDRIIPNVEKVGDVLYVNKCSSKQVSFTNIKCFRTGEYVNTKANNQLIAHHNALKVRTSDIDWLLGEYMMDPQTISILVRWKKTMQKAIDTGMIYMPGIKGALAKNISGGKSRADYPLKLKRNSKGVSLLDMCQGRLS